VSAVADYEVRRELLRIGASRAIVRLDKLRHQLGILDVPLTTWEHAAQLWAIARQQGYPTAGDAALDADVLIAAQAQLIGAIVVTENATHLRRFVEARHWRDIAPDAQ
jgi:predicted nucleic acid-binding protein